MRLRGVTVLAVSVALALAAGCSPATGVDDEPEPLEELDGPDRFAPPPLALPGLTD